MNMEVYIEIKKMIVSGILIYFDLGIDKLTIKITIQPCWLLSAVSNIYIPQNQYNGKALDIFSVDNYCP